VQDFSIIVTQTPTVKNLALILVLDKWEGKNSLFTQIW